MEEFQVDSLGICETHLDATEIYIRNSAAWESVKPI